MKRTVLVLLTAFSVQLSAFAQGPLTPPGAPAPTMKTLAQVEPRTPITNAPVTISASGSYYLTTNLTVASGTAITIAASGVTLDLNGFTISSTETNSLVTYGIQINSGLRNLAIYNGFIQGSVTNNGSGIYGGVGFAYGIVCLSSALANVRVSHVSVSGCLSDGINLSHGNSTVAESCTVRSVGGEGITASIVKSCAVDDCGRDAITGDQVSDCHGVGYLNGVTAFTVAQNCYGSSSNSSFGVHAITAQNCFGESVHGTGLSAETAVNCKGTSVDNIGLDCAVSDTSCYGFAANSNFQGMHVTGIANTCGGGNSGNGTAIQAVIGIGCVVYGGTNSIPAANKFLGTL